MRIGKWSTFFAISILNTGCAPSPQSAEESGDNTDERSPDAVSRSTGTRSTPPRRRRGAKPRTGALTSGSTGPVHARSTGQAWLISDYKSNYNPDFSTLFDELQRRGIKWTGDRVAISSEDPTDITNMFKMLRPSDPNQQYRVVNRPIPNACSGAERRVYLIPATKNMRKTEYVFVVDVVFDGSISFAEEIRKLEGNPDRKYDVQGINMDLKVELSQAVITAGLGDAVMHIAGECKIRAVRVGRAFESGTWANYFWTPSKAFTTFHVPN
jgi:hypothetical protein